VRFQAVAALLLMGAELSVLMKEDVAVVVVISSMTAGVEGYWSCWDVVAAALLAIWTTGTEVGGELTSTRAEAGD